jgi:cyclase
LSLTKRIIPCLDVKDNKVVKGVRFLNLTEAGDPVSVSKRYQEMGADELCFLDITASSDKREIIAHLVEQVANVLFIPFTVGGGIRSLEDIRNILRKGADKVSINTQAFLTPELLTQGMEIFGSQCIVAAIDAKWNALRNRHEIYLNGGRTETGREAIDWAMEAESRGAGELLLTSMDRDGTKDGYDIELLSGIHNKVSIPVIASGGVGNLDHILEGFTKGHADAALAASIFHYSEYTVQEVKIFLRQKGIPVRLEV